MGQGQKSRWQASSLGWDKSGHTAIGVPVQLAKSSPLGWCSIVCMYVSLSVCVKYVCLHVYECIHACVCACVCGCVHAHVDHGMVPASSSVTFHFTFPRWRALSLKLGLVPAANQQTSGISLALAPPPVLWFRWMLPHGFEYQT